MKGSLVIQAIQQIYPNIQGGFVYWETQQDGTEWDNPEDGLLWENNEFRKPSWEDIMSKIPSEEESEIRELKASLIAIRKQFLNTTDFRVLRFIDEGTPYPDETKQKRIRARQEINEIESCIVLVQLKQFSETFE